jgi:hypothetical protein
MRHRVAARSVPAMSLVELSSPRRDARKRPTSPLLCLRVLVHRGRLDRLLAEGRSPTTDRRLTLRAIQLARPALRAALAACLCDAMRSIDESAITRLRRPQVPVDAASVRVCTPELRELAHSLTDINPRVRGVAITHALLTDGGGPLYIGPPDRLRDSLLTARSAL